MIQREEMQEVVKSYEQPVPLILGSHSALDASAGARNYHLRRIIYTTPERANIYLQNPIVGRDKPIKDLPFHVRNDVIIRNDPKDIRKTTSWNQCILILDNYKDILKYTDEMRELECIQIPNRAFSVYVGGEACREIEEKFDVPIIGTRSLLKIENREEVEKNYYWYLEQAGIPHPEEYLFDVKSDQTGIKFKKSVDRPLVLKVPHKSRRLERGFIFAANSSDLEEKVEHYIKTGIIDPKDLTVGRAEEYVPGVTANFNFFYSPLYAKQDWGESEKYLMAAKGISQERARMWLANEFMSIDERREATHDGVIRMGAELQLKVNWGETPYPRTFEVTAHIPISLRESLIRKIHPVADRFLEKTMEIDPPGMIGAYCIQTLITFKELRGDDPDFKWVKKVGHGLYDIPEGGALFDHVPKVQDVATRHGGGTNTHMGIGAQYSNAKYLRRMSMGDRIALELVNARERRMLPEIVT
jgi:5-formaminoimidazole-4-carboxamide-1-(beta)-D-ribofuranosyl 5'-monophosphate synthetase